VNERGGAILVGISWKDPEYECIQCGGPIADGLARFGSALCHDCRDEQGVDVVVTRKRRSIHRRTAGVRSLILTLRRR
jgi:hypothetical protein